ncbi:hypothetical protein WN944_021102 [Citrus x changshan-huyou]|uniref:Protein phosphatase n=1 Tax=Citrus x changshan-huyou TaxID=2935761 RepID=A0AAP0N2I7_9ROSI
MPAGVLTKLNPTVCSGFKRVCNPKSSVLRQGKLLFGNSGSSEFLPYPIRLLSETMDFSLSSSCKRSSIPSSGTKAVGGDVLIDDLVSNCGNGLEFVKSSGVYFKDRSQSRCHKARMSSRKRESPSGGLVSGYFIFDSVVRSSKSNVLGGGLCLKNIHTSSSMCFSAGSAHDLSFDGGSRDEQMGSVASEQTILGERALKLRSGSCYLPHPAKEETGGEDAHFICGDEQVIGVADGVGGWADVGVDAGEFARELMSHSFRAVQEEPTHAIDPARVLEKAHSSTKAKGSSTACIIALTSKAIHAVNLGDSGFMVVRDGCTIFQSPVQQHGFNFTYQLESGNTGDLPSSGQVFTIPAAPGDVIVAGTDGLFDNLYNNEVTAVVVHALRAGLGPQVTAQKIAALARQRAQDRNRQTPFSTAAQDAGFRYYGGKLDDITVVVSYISGHASV